MSERGAPLREIQASQWRGMVAGSKQGGTGSSASNEVYHYVHQGGKHFFFDSCRSPLASSPSTVLSEAHNALPSYTELSHGMGS